MARSSKLLILLLSCALIGCTARTAPLGLVVPGTGQGQPQPVAAAQPSTGSSSNAGYGTLHLSIRWPAQPQGYHAALLPTSTNAVAVWVQSAGTDVVTPTVVARTSGSSTATADIQVEAASNLSVVVKAYRESNPSLTSSQPIAQGSNASVNVVRSKSVSVPITLTPVFVPSITGFSANVGLAGDTVTLSGTNFGSASIAVPSVSFNGVLASSVVRNSDTSLTVQVPSGATTGNVVVTADGVPSSSTATFWLPSALSLTAPKASWDPSPANNRLVKFGQSLQFTATPTWYYKSGDATDSYGTPPAATWTTSDQTAGSVDSTGLFTAANNYHTTTIGASVGSLQKTLSVGLVAPAPVITSISPTNGGPSPLSGTPTVVTINGNGFGPATNSTLVVSLAGSQITNFTKVSDTQLTFVVPNSGATTGAVKVTSYGADSANTPTFQVIQSLSVSPSSGQTLHPGDTLQFSVSAVDTQGNPVASPSVTWNSSNTSVASFNSGGLLTAVSYGSTQVTALAGTINSAPPPSFAPSFSVDYNYDVNDKTNFGSNSVPATASNPAYYEQPFVPSVGTLKAVDVPVVPTSGSTLHMEIRTDAAGLPSASAVWSGTATLNSAVSGYVYALPQTVNLTAGTLYHLVFGTPNGGNYYFYYHQSTPSGWSSWGVPHQSIDGTTWVPLATPTNAPALWIRTGY